MAQPERTLKRKRVSVANKNQEISDPKRKRVLISTDLKTRTYHFWYNSIIRIGKLYTFTDETILDNINLSCQLQSVLFSAHSHNSQVGNGTKTDEQITGRAASFYHCGVL